MVECSGEALRGGKQRVTGRLLRVGDRLDKLSDSARIVIWDGLGELGAEMVSAAVGIVILGAPKDGIFTDTDGYGLPVIRITEDAYKLTEELLDEIAILDCVRQRLYVDPDIEVINSYVGELAALPAKRLPWIRTDGDKVSGSCDGIMVDVADDEDGAYELLCEMADKNTGERIIALMGSDGDPLSGIRGVLRAAVWGRISVLFRVNLASEAEKLLSMTHTAFCSLEKEGREFNGFIPKGIMIQTPIMLASAPSRFADFFVFDCNALIKGYTSTENSGIAEVLSLVIDYASKMDKGKYSIYARGEVAAASADFFDRKGQLTEIYTDKATAEKLYKWI